MELYKFVSQLPVSWNMFVPATHIYMEIPHSSFYDNGNICELLTHASFDMFSYYYRLS